MAYAEDTSVSVDRSQAEIHKMLTKHGADEISLTTGRDRAAVGFIVGNLMVELRIEFPPLTDFQKSPAGKTRTKEQAFKAWEQAGRSRWRSLSLVLKAKLEAVDVGISTLEQEFLAGVVLSIEGGQRVTMGDRLVPQIQEIVTSGRVPRLLPGRTNG